MAFDISHGSRAKPNCGMCPAAVACLSGSASQDDGPRWSDMMEPHSPVFPEGKSLFMAGEPATMVYFVRAGCIKTFSVDEDGNERVRGFHLPGDVIGMDALGSRCYPSSAGAVVPSQVCAIPRARLLELMSNSPLLMRGLLSRASQDLASALAFSGDYSADQRIAAFLLDMNDRLDHRPGETQCLRLPMSRREMGSFLRLATETVCRVLTRLEQQGSIELKNKAIHLKHAERLADLAAPVGLVSRMGELPLAA